MVVQLLQQQFAGHAAVAIERARLLRAHLQPRGQVREQHAVAHLVDLLAALA